MLIVQDYNFLNLWDYNTKKRIKSIKFYGLIDQFKFTEDSKFIYVACVKKLY